MYKQENKALIDLPSLAFSILFSVQTGSTFPSFFAVYINTNELNLENKKMGLSKTKTKKNPIIFIIFCFSTIVGLTAAAQQQKTKSFPFIGFKEGTDTSFFNFTGSSSIDGGALQLTPDNENQPLGYFNKSGRIMYYKPYKLWQSETDQDIASFNTTFVMNVYRNKTWNPGEGLAFLIAPGFDVPDQSHGQWLGLTNATTDGNPENRLVAVEFDTEKQEFDPDDNHIGLNINSVRSNTTVSLNQFGFLISPEESRDYRVWIQYNGKSKVMEVYMANKSDERPKKPYLKSTINLKDHVKQDSYFGFAASTGNPGIQFNCVLEWDLEVEVFSVEKDRKWLKIGVGVGVSVTVLLVLFGVKFGVGYVRKRRRDLDEESNVLGTLKRLPGMPREFRYKDLKKATNDFHESMVLGQGGFGVVYRGVLRDWEGSSTSSATTTNEVAVKKFSRDNIKGKDDFLAELTIIHRLRHKHLVRLVGWCYEKGKLLLVYDYMPNGSLEKHLYESSDTLNWRYRHKILAGVASALHYLHNDYDQKVVHRDLKASNILLDSDYNARLGDFGLARAIENERNSYAELGLAGVPGTMGYVAPECFHTGKATPESDVFGFGAVVLEVVCGKSPGVKIQHQEHEFTLVDWVWMLHREGRILEAVDERLDKEYIVEEASRLLLLGLACSHPVDSERPQTQAICQIIAETLLPPHVPPFKPVFTWPNLGLGIAFSSIESDFSNITLSS